jgi:4-hydroxy-tetrahydrodipicolinate synthase
MEESRRAHYRLLDLYKHLFLETNPGPIKELMNLAGMPAGPLRLPLVSCEEKNVEILRRDLKDLGL